MVTVLVLGVLLAGQANSQGRSSTNRPLAIWPEKVDVGGFPVNMERSPDGRFIAVTNTGIEQNLTILDAATGKVLSKRAFDSEIAGKKEKDGLYFGLRFGQRSGTLKLYASQGASDRVSEFQVGADGQLSAEPRVFLNPRPGLIGAALPNFAAGLALSSDAQSLFVVNNQTSAMNGFRGSLSVFDVSTAARKRIVELPGFPLDLVTVTDGPHKDKKAYVSCERDGVIAVVDLSSMAVAKEVRTGDNPTHLLLNRDQTKLYVANSSSDTVSVIDTTTDAVLSTWLVRPSEQRGLPGATPLGLGLSPDERTLYVALADLNAIAVIDTSNGQLRGFIPTGWYPTDVQAVGDHLYATVAKGDVPVNPNLPKGRPESNYDPREQFRGPSPGANIRRMLRGLVARTKTPGGNELRNATTKALQNAMLANIDETRRRLKGFDPGIEHVIYIVKENRTYDQILGDLKGGVGDPSLHLYGDDVCPNQRALAKRFGLLDNFYVCAEMSADGWAWSTAGIACEYNQRNAQYEYSGRKRNYDYEGQNNGSPVDELGIRNVNDPPGRYLWDAALRAGVEFRNYGMYMASGVPIRGTDGKPIAEDNSITMRAFRGRAAPDFRMYDLDYAESDAWDRHGKTFPKRLATWGTPPAKSRFEAWNRDYQRLIAARKVPPLMLVRFGNDHTAGTSPGSPSPAAMIADNDYAVGQLVEAVSRGPLWKKTCIIILEDDAQGGYDHVDSHRSIAFVVSPYAKPGVYSKFYNTDSAIRTVTELLGLAPMNQFVATAWPLEVFGKSPTNVAPFTAILPPAQTFVANTATSYRAKDSERLFHTYREESAPDRELADILWGDRKGAHSPRPKLPRP